MRRLTLTPEILTRYTCVRGLPGPLTLHEIRIRRAFCGDFGLTNLSFESILIIKKFKKGDKL